MTTYFEMIKTELKDWKKALVVIIFTVARIIYGYAWLEAGWGKATSGWLSVTKPHAYGLIAGMVNNLTGPKVHGLDPLHLNSLWSWIATNIFNGMPPVTDYLVVISEIAVGLLMIFGFRLFWAAILALFLNIQFITAGSGNNFGYIWTNIIVMNLTKYFELIGVSGYLKFKKGQKKTAA